MKHCKTCNQTKPYTEFCKHSRTKDGYQSSCKQCIVEYNRSKGSKYHNKWRDKLGAGVYALIDTATDEVLYIGETSTLNRRKKQHRETNSKTTHSIATIYNLNPNSFKFKVLKQEDNKEKRLELETFYIKKFQPKFNNQKN